MGHSHSLVTAPFDRLHTSSYWHSTLTMALSHTVSKIINVASRWNLGQGSFKAMENGTTWQSYTSYQSAMVSIALIYLVVPFSRNLTLNIVTLNLMLGVNHPANLCTICTSLKSTDPGLSFCR